MDANRDQSTENYREKYGLGVIDRDNSLAKYDAFLANMGERITLAQIVEQHIKQQKTDKKIVRILDIGCGTGGALREIKEKFSDRIETIGIDLLPCQASGIDRCIAGDAWTVDFPADCDVVFSFRALHEIGHCPDLLEKICASLAAGGTALLSFRLATLENGTRVRLGEMTEQDESFLVNLPFAIRDCRLAKTVFFDSSAQKVVTGVFVKIEKN
ncbi:MAG: class I SAM-dependent methyltransferase [Candidatus Diapherotrites archaeon]|nr:class I SAM-dependent methyltransferase [Candidatus Diapherotrites archaeon]